MEPLEPPLDPPLQIFTRITGSIVIQLCSNKLNELIKEGIMKEKDKGH